MEFKKLNYADFVQIAIASMTVGAAPDEHASDERIKREAEYLYNQYLKN